MNTRTISERELRNDSAKIIRELQEGATFVLTNNGSPVGELRPLHVPQRVVSRDVLTAAAAHWEPIDVNAFTRDVDDVVDQSLQDVDRLHQGLTLANRRAAQAIEQRDRLQAVVAAAHELLDEDRTSWSPEHDRLAAALRHIYSPPPVI